MTPYSHLTCWKCRQLKPVDQFKRSACGKYPTDLCLDCMTDGANLATVIKDEIPKYKFVNIPHINEYRRTS